MSPRMQFLTAAVLFIAGLAKAVAHMTTAYTIGISTCLGNEIVLPVQASMWERAHCWGCYAAVAGVVWMIALTLGSAARRRALARQS